MPYNHAQHRTMGQCRFRCSAEHGDTLCYSLGLAALYAIAAERYPFCEKYQFT